MKKIFLLLSLAISVLSGRCIAQANFNAFQIQDIAKQNIQFKQPIKRVILGNGNLAYAVAVINPKQQPFQSIIAWGDGFKVSDYTGYQAYRQRFPDLEKVPTFKDTDVSAVNLEKIISLRPDVVIFNLSSKSAIDGSNFPKSLAKLNIPIVYVDFSLDANQNTANSITILGQIFAQPQRARQFNQFRQQQIDRVTQKIQQIPAQRKQPQVFIERAAGLYDECCLSYGNHNLGRMLHQLRAENIAERWIKGYGMVHPEQLMTSHPDLIIMTGADWQFYSPHGQWINLGPGIDVRKSRLSMKILTQRPTYKYLTAVKQQRVHALWHPFYDSPYQFIAMQQMAKWLYPDLFQDLQPEATFQNLHQQFLPIPYQSGYWFSMRPSP